MNGIVNCDTCNGEVIEYRGVERLFRHKKWVTYLKFWCFNCEAMFKVRAKQNAELYLAK